MERLLSCFSLLLGKVQSENTHKRNEVNVSESGGKMSFNWKIREKKKRKDSFARTKSLLLPMEAIKTKTMAMPLLGCFQDAGVESLFFPF